MISVVPAVFVSQNSVLHAMLE